MARFHFNTALIAATAGLACMSAASAQFGSIFGNQSPPRPPGSVPGAPVQQQYPQQQYPQQGYPQQQYPQQYPPAQMAPPPGGGGRGNAAVRSEPLPPPSGGPQQQQQQPPLPEMGAQTPPAASAPPLRRGAAQPADPPPQPGDEVVAEPPTQRVPNGQAVFAGLDKITGRIISFDVAIDETVQFGALQVTPRACYTRPPTEAPNTNAFLEVDELTLQGEVRRIFTGWMFAASPGLHAVEHPIYDVWLKDCKAPAVASAPEVDTPEAAPAKAPARAKAPPRSPNATAAGRAAAPAR